MDTHTQGILHGKLNHLRALSPGIGYGYKCEYVQIPRFAMLGPWWTTLLTLSRIHFMPLISCDQQKAHRLLKNIFIISGFAVGANLSQSPTSIFKYSNTAPPAPIY